jgi:hypothetical protein
VSGRVRAATGALLTERAVMRARQAAGVDARVDDVDCASTPAVVDAVAAAALVNVRVIESHRVGLSRQRDLLLRLGREVAEADMAAERATLAVQRLLSAQTDDAARKRLTDEAAVILRDLAALAKLPRRIDMAEVLSRAWRNVVLLERQAYCVEVLPPELDDSWEALLTRAEAARPRPAPRAASDEVREPADDVT